MNATVVAASRPVSLQFLIPLLILENLTRGNQDPIVLYANPSDGLAIQRLDERTETFKLPPGYNAYPEVGVAYSAYSSRATWHAARKGCASEGGYLAVIDSQKKLDIIEKLISKTYLSPWIGVHNFYNSQEWCSVENGSPLSFFKWHSHYPLDVEEARCVFLHYSSGRTNYFNCDCENRRPFVCEIPIIRQCN